VIDTKPWWYHDVSKLILGSMTDGDDKEDPPSLAPETGDGCFIAYAAACAGETT
jgi:hypothetical protein